MAVVPFAEGLRTQSQGPNSPDSWPNTPAVDHHIDRRRRVGAPGPALVISPRGLCLLFVLRLPGGRKNPEPDGPAASSTRSTRRKLPVRHHIGRRQSRRACTCLSSTARVGVAFVGPRPVRSARCRFGEVAAGCDTAGPCFPHARARNIPSRGRAVAERVDPFVLPRPSLSHAHARVPDRRAAMPGNHFLASKPGSPLGCDGV